MDDMYKRILKLCEQRGIKPGRVCADTGLSRGIMSDLKMGRTKELSAKNTKIIADYFDVSADYLLGIETENTPTPKGEEYSEKERAIIDAYRNKPEFQSAVDVLLGLKGK